MLNKLLILHLAPFMLKTQNLTNSKAEEIEQTLKANIAFTESVVKYAKSNPKIIQLFSGAKGTQLFFETLFNWVDSLHSHEFDGLIKSALAEYQKNIWFGSKVQEVEKIQSINHGQQAKIVAKIFLGEHSSSLSEILLSMLVGEIKKETRADYIKYQTSSDKQSQKFQKYRNPGYLFINQFEFNEHSTFYLKALKANQEVLERAQGQQENTSSNCI